MHIKHLTFLSIFMHKKLFFYIKSFLRINSGVFVGCLFFVVDQYVIDFLFHNCWRDCFIMKAFERMPHATTMHVVALGEVTPIIVFARKS